MLRIADRLPDELSVDAVYVPGLCLTRDRTRLTLLNEAAMREAVGDARSMGARYLLYAGCYGGPEMERELSLRRRLANAGGVPDERIREIREIADTREELCRLAIELEVLGAESVLLVTDEYHMPRVARWASAILPDNVEVFHRSVRAPKYEYTWEPSRIKSFRFGVKPLWIAWNVLLYWATPILLRPRATS
jgi:uncharacterized SAM-binding protein YcdF (DUF218 family)